MRRGETRAELGARNRRLARGQVGDLRAVERAIEREAQSLDRPRDELELEAIAFGAADVGRELDRIRHAVRLNLNILPVDIIGRDIGDEKIGRVSWRESVWQYV